MDPTVQATTEDSYNFVQLPGSWNWSAWSYSAGQYYDPLTVGGEYHWNNTTTYKEYHYEYQVYYERTGLRFENNPIIVTDPNNTPSALYPGSSTQSPAAGYGPNGYTDKGWNYFAGAGYYWQYSYQNSSNTILNYYFKD